MEIQERRNVDDRRATDLITNQLLEAIREDVHSVSSELYKHIEKEEKLSVVRAEESTFIQMLIRREEKKIALWDAVIEKTLSSLVWAAFIGLGVAFWEYIKGAIKT